MSAAATEEPASEPGDDAQARLRDLLERIRSCLQSADELDLNRAGIHLHSAMLVIETIVDPSRP